MKKKSKAAVARKPENVWYSDWVVQYRPAGRDCNWSERQQRYPRLAEALKAAEAERSMGLYEARVGRNTDQGWCPAPEEAAR